MAAKENLTKAANIDVTARQIDFVSRFTSNVKALMDVIGITRLEKEVPGAELRVLRGKVTLVNGAVGEGEEIPYSLGEVEEEPIGKATMEKYCKAVSAESIQKHGYAVAVQKTDNAFLNKLQNIITGKFYTFLATGELEVAEDTFQMALSMAKGAVLDKFSSMDLDATDVVAFVNTEDIYTYLGGAPISTQTVFGMQYIKDFLGYNTVFICDKTRVPRGTIYATPVENLMVDYIDPASSDFAAAGLEFTVDGDTPFIGFHTEGNYRTLVSENTAIMGIYLLAEYIDGVAVATFPKKAASSTT